MRRYLLLAIILVISGLGIFLFSNSQEAEITISNYWPDVPNYKNSTPERISWMIMDRHLKCCESKHVEINTRIKAYKINSINVIDQSSYGILFCATYSINPIVVNSQWFAGSGKHDDKTGWLENKTEYVFVRKYIRDKKEIYGFVRGGSSPITMD